MSKSRVTKPSRIPPWATPRTEASLAAFKSKATVKGSTETDLIEATNKLVQDMANLERENAILCDFINREMGMTAADPRVTEL